MFKSRRGKILFIKFGVTILGIKIKDIISQLNKENILIDVHNINNIGLEIDNICYDSRNVTKNSVFICKGIYFNQKYLIDAISKGSCLYISEKKYADEIPYIIVSNARKALSIVSKLFYGKHIDELQKIAITGTKGKSTTSFFVKNVLDEYLLSKKRKPAGIISSISTFDGYTLKESTLTTPESLEVYKLLNNAYKNGLEYFVCEVSSIAYKYDRVYGINFNVGVFLNIGYDHISGVEHKDFDDYFSCKLELLKNSKYIVINEELLTYEKVKDILKDKDRNDVFIFGYGKDATYRINNITKKGMNTSFDIIKDDKVYNYEINLHGNFNVENAAACIAACDILGIDYKYMRLGLLHSKIKGRGEIYKSKDNKKIAVVDYAHNGLSLNRYFEQIKKVYPDRKHICVIDSSGSKAFNRRKEVGQACYKFCDEIILTTLDLYNESFESICSDILEYIPDKSKVKLIKDRTKAIETAILHSDNKDEIISVLGKG